MISRDGNATPWLRACVRVTPIRTNVLEVRKRSDICTPDFLNLGVFFLPNCSLHGLMLLSPVENNSQARDWHHILSPEFFVTTPCHGYDSNFGKRFKVGVGQSSKQESDTKS